jgi:hypothetical protein
MIDVADTITTCAELEDNVSIMNESKLFLKLQDAMDAMQQDGGGRMEVRLFILARCLHVS